MEWSKKAPSGLRSRSVDSASDVRTPRSSSPQYPVYIIRRTNGMLCWAALTFLSSSTPTQYLSPDDRQNDHQGPWANLDDVLYR